MTHILKTTVGLCLLSLSHFAAAQAQWAGAGANNLWSTTGNWVGGEVPVGSQTVSFPAAAAGSTAQFNLPLTTLQLIDIQKCGFSVTTDPLTSQTVTLTGTQVITGVCNSAVQNEQSVLRMNLQLGNDKTINALSSDAGIARTRRLIVEAPGGNGINFGTNLTLNADSSAGATGARVFLETRIASGINIVKTGNGQVDFLQSNTYSGFTTVQAGILNVADANALGDTAPASSTLVQAGATLQISGLSPIVERVSLIDNSNVVGLNPNFAAIGAGAIANAVDISGSAAQPTGVFIADGTELRLQGGITATSPIVTSILYLSKPLGGTIALGGATTHSGLTKIGANTSLRLDGAVINDDRLSNNSIIEIDAGGQLNLNQNAASTETIAGLQGAGDVVLGNMDLTLNGEIDTTFSGSVSGGTVIKTGFNVVTALGSFSPSELRINQGDLILDADSTAVVNVGGGKFVTSGSRTIRGLTMTPTVPIGQLEINGSSIARLTVLPTVVTPNGIAISGSSLKIDLSALGSDQIVLSNSNSVGGITLSGGTLIFTGNSSPGMPVIILDNQRPAANLIAGVFAAPFNNVSGTATINGNTYSYTYTGGDGNDFSITRQALGTDYTWTGLGSSPNWNDAMNWSPSVVPPPGSALIFPLGVVNKTASNNLPFGSVFSSIRVQDTGYLINGVNLSLTAAVPIIYAPPATVGPASALLMPISLSAINPRINVNLTGSAFTPQLFNIMPPSGALSYSGQARIEIVCVSCAARAEVAVKLASPAGSSVSIFAPNGRLVLEEATHDGVTRVEAGTVVAANLASLGVSDGSLSSGTEIWRGAQLVVGSNVGNEHLNFKNLGTGNAPMLAPISDGLGFSGPILAEGNFRLMASQPNYFSVSSQIIGAGNMEIVFSGTPVRQVDTRPAALLGLAPGVTLSGASNTNTGNVAILGGAVLVLNAADKLPSTAIVDVSQFSDLQVNTPQTIEGLIGAGDVLFFADLRLRNNDTKLFSGRLQGADGSLIMDSANGTGIFRATGTTAPNDASYRVLSGTLDLEGNSSSGAVRIAGGTLAGNGATTGAVAGLIGATGKIAPLLADLGTGNLDMADSLTYEAVVNGSAAGAHSELQVTGSVRINASGGAAALTLLSSALIPAATVITLVSNDAADPVLGTFANAPDDSIVTADNGQTFLIDYQGGTGNDVTLTRQAAGLIDVTISNINITEGLSGTTTANVVFTRSANSTAFTLNGLLTNGTATAGDFVAGSVTVNFAIGGPLVVAVPVQVNGDNVVEAPETFSIVVASLPMGVNAISPGVVTIINDDTSSIAFNSSTFAEGNGGGTGPATLVVGLSNPIQGVVSFNMTSSGGTATSGADYTPFNQSVSVASNQIQANPVLSVVRDAIVEADESVTFTLSGLALPSGILPSDVTLVAASAQALIQNDDSAVVLVTATTQAEGNSGNTPFIIGLTLSAPVQGDVSVRYTPTQLAGDSATPVTDFATVPQIATFGSGVTSASVTIQVVGDTVVEPDETFSSVLDQLTIIGGANPSAFTFGLLNKVTIQNDDLNAATSTALSFNPSPSAAGQPYTATALVRNLSATFPTGTVVISTVPASSETCTTPALVQFAANDTSTASCQITSALPGVRTFVATYVPTGAFSASSSTNVSHVVQGQVGDLQISSSLPAGVVTGQPYTITVQLVPTIPSSPLPTGNISIQHFPSTQLDTGTMTAGSVSIPTLSPTAVIKTLFVRYTDPSGVYPNRSSAFAQIVNKADVALIGLNSNPQPSSVNQAVTASFALSVVAPGAGTPTGTVTVTDGVDQCVATLPATSCIITLSTAGNRTLTYRYDGSTDYNAALANRPHSVGNSGSGSDIEVTVSNGLTVMPQDRIVQYQIVGRVVAGDSASSVRIEAPVPAGIVSQIWSCVSENGASCPPNSTNINGAIDALVTLPQAGSAVFVVSALTQTVEGRVQFAASASVAAPVVDPNLQNNSATDNDAVSNTATESGFEDE